MESLLTYWNVSALEVFSTLLWIGGIFLVASVLEDFDDFDDLE